ncbi:MAG: AbrB/MazE/SpoVT family DNA-binding domain-containing protein [Tepidiformaceae bacterium]
MIPNVRRHITRVGKRNQVTIPASMLRALCVSPGEHVLLRMADGNLALEKAEDPLRRLSGMFHVPGAPMLTAEDERHAARERARKAEERDLRSRS